MEVSPVITSAHRPPDDRRERVAAGVAARAGPAPTLVECAALMPRDARPPRAAAVVIAASLVAPLLLPASARASSSERIDLRWTAPAECPAADTVRAEVDRLLGPSSARPPAPIPVTAEVTRDDQGAWRVHLETPGEGAPRVREVHGATCSAIADATATILALMIDPAATLAGPSAKGSAVGADRSPVDGARSPVGADRSPVEADRSPVGADRSPVGADRSPVVPDRSPVVPDRSPPPPSFRVAAWAGLDTASLSRLSVGFGLQGAFVLGAQRFEVGVAFRPVRAVTVAARPTTGGDVDLLTGAAGTCRSWRWAALEFGPCLGFELGRLHAAGFGVTSPGEGSSLWAAVEGEGLLGYRITSRIGLGLRLGAVVPLLRPRFVLANVGPVYQPPGAAARGAVGVEVAF